MDIVADLDTSGIKDLDRIIEQFERSIKKANQFGDSEAQKIAAIHRLAERNAESTARGFRQSHGEVVKLRKEMQEVSDLWGSLFKAPVKFKPFKSANIAKDILSQMGVDRLGDEMMEAAASIRKHVYESNKEVKKTTNLYKDYRKTLTGVLIDLHWLRILGQNSKVVAKSTEILGKSLGYLADVILIPMLPIVMRLSKTVLDIARGFSNLPKPLRLLLSAFGGIIVGGLALATVLATAYTSLMAFVAAVNASTISLGAKAVSGSVLTGGATTIATGGAVGVGGVGAGLGIGYLNESWLGTGAKATANRMAFFSNLLGGTKIPYLAEGGIVTSPTLGLLGEAGAEAILPLEKFSGGLFSSLFGKAARGGGIGGMGLTKGSVPELLVKGFSMVSSTTESGFKTTNMLLAGLLSLFGGGIGGVGGAAASIWDFLTTSTKSVWEFIIAVPKSVWEFIQVSAKSVWEFISVIPKSIWEFISTPTRSVWEFLLTPTRSVWDFLTIESRTISTGVGTGTGTPTGGGTTTPGKTVLYTYGEYEGGYHVVSVYSDGTTSEGEQATQQQMEGAGQGGGYGNYIPTNKENESETPLQYLTGGENVGGTIVSKPYLSPVGTPINMSTVGQSDTLGSAYPWSLNTFAELGLAASGLINAGRYGVGSLINDFLGSGIPSFQSGGTMGRDGLAFLHSGETVTPASGGGSITINNPIFQISGKNDRELFESFMRLLKIEGGRGR